MITVKERTMKSLSLQELCKQAINNEVEESRLLSIAIEKAYDKNIKRLLHSLVKDEEKHFLIMLKIFNKMTEGLASFTYNNNDRKKAVENINERIKEAGLDENADIKDIIKFAIGDEKRSQIFYQYYIKHIKDPILKKILERLVMDEKKHESSFQKIWNSLK